MPKKTVLNIIMISAILLAIAAAIPTETASKVNVFGYNSLCSFAPISSVILLTITVLTYLVSKKNADE